MKITKNDLGRLYGAVPCDVWIKIIDQLFCDNEEINLNRDNLRKLGKLWEKRLTKLNLGSCYVFDYCNFLKHVRFYVFGVPLCASHIQPLKAFESQTLKEIKIKVVKESLNR